MRSIIIIFLSLSAFVSNAQGKHSASSSGDAPQIIEATVQKTISGRHENQPRVEYRMVIIWKSKTSPSAMFWKPDAKSWFDVTTAKPEKRPGMTPNDYMIYEAITKLKDIHQGDKIIVSPHNHEHDGEAMPAKVKNMPTSCLYYKMGDQWQYVKIKPKTRPDITLP